MSRWVGLELDAQQLRVLVGRVRREGIAVDRVLSIDGAAPGGDTADWGEAVNARLAAEGISRGDCCIVVSRNDVELRRMTLPPVPDAELPEMVRLQAFSEFASLTDQFLLDFVPLSAAGGTAERVVLAAALRPTVRQKWQQFEAATGLTAKSMVFGPAVTARTVHDLSTEPKADRRLVVQPQRDAWTLIVSQAGLPLLVRWVRRSEHQSDSDLLLGEIRRTRAAAYSQLDGLQIEEIVLLAERNAGQAIADQLKLDDALPVRVLDPLAGLAGADRLASGIGRGEFASLVGAFRDAQAESVPVLDFLQPRRKPQPPDRRRLMGLVAAVAAIVVLAAGGWIWWQLNQLHGQRLAAESLLRTLKTQIGEETAKGGQKQLDQWAKWRNDEVQWLAEVARLSEKLPPADAMKIKSLTGSVVTATGGTLTVNGVARESTAIADLDQALSDTRHRVASGGTHRDESDKNYAWKFQQTVTVGEPRSATSTSRTARARPGRTQAQNNPLPRSARGARTAPSADD